MDISINAKVYCQDTLCGHTQAIILDPDSEVITHVVVKENKTPHTQRLVPFDMIDASLANNVHLNCDETTFRGLLPFVETEYVQASVPEYLYLQDYDNAYLKPIVVPEKVITPRKHYLIPGDELAIDKGTSVYSADGLIVGKVDEFLVDEEDGHITHLIMREGHLWGQKDVVIPVEEIDKVRESRLRLKLSKEKIGELPAVPATAKWI